MKKYTPIYLSDTGRSTDWLVLLSIKLIKKMDHESPRQFRTQNAVSYMCV
jgi:hypothetical protein